MQAYQKRGYLFENYKLFHILDQGVHVDYHYHEFCKLLFLLSGSGSYTVDGQRYLLQPGDVVLINSGSVHRPELGIGERYERVILYISPDFLRQESTPDCDLLDCFQKGNSHVLRLPEHQKQKLQAMVDALEQELQDNRYGRQILSKALLLRLMVQLCRYVNREDIPYVQPLQPKNDRILDILQYLDAHSAEDLDIDRLAEEFYISKYHMMRLFRQETGITIHTYLNQRRLAYARSLIHKNVRATDACYRAGFRSYSSFTRAYAKHFGTTPTGRKDPAIALQESYE